MKTRVIAEPGSTAEGQLERFRALIDAAAAAGADVFKSQWVSDPARLCAQRQAPEYQDAYRRICYPADWHRELARRCETLGMEYAISMYLREDIRVAAEFATRLKVSSFEADSNLLHWALTEGGKAQVIVSTGMMSEDRIRSLVILRNRYFNRERLAILHCVSAYPAPDDQMNLAAIRALDLDGLSDHSRNVEMGGDAVCAGAGVIETHIRLSDTDPNNPDYATALTPREFTAYVDRIRQRERRMGNGRRQLQPCEAEMAKYRVRSA